MRVWEWAVFAAGVLLIGAVMVVVFLFSFEFFLAFGPFVMLFWMIRDAVSRRRERRER